ncbi:MAG: asparagine synthetase B, partial [Deltaproteobacteria bacterium]
MCGIVGLIKNASVDELQSNVRQMLDSIHHRGPDELGQWCEDGVVFGHTRLSILDLSPAGSQPMKSSCGRYRIVFNGEIYNWKELREELERENNPVKWRGHSDTEVLLAAIG